MSLKKNTQKKIILAVTILVLLLLGWYFLSYRQSSNDQPVPSPNSTGSNPAKGDSNSQTNGTGKSTPTDNSGSPSPDSATLTEPSGNFVSTHRPAPSMTESSTCNTTPGAQCSITFNNGSTTKSLPAKITDASGAAYWTWTPAQIGLSNGDEWHIRAVATLGSQKLTSDDAIPLVVTE